MLTNFNAKDLQHLRQLSFGKPSRDTGGSNPPCSGSQSPIFVDSPGAPMLEDSRPAPEAASSGEQSLADFGSGEFWMRPDQGDLEILLTGRELAGHLHATLLVPTRSRNSQV